MSIELLLAIITSAIVVIGAVFAVAKGGLDYWRKWRVLSHPLEVEKAWGLRKQCHFFINDRFRSAPRWESLGDVEVDIVGGSFPPGTHVYLIGSRQIPRPLRYPEVLRHDLLALQIKKQASIRFAKKWQGCKLKGEWFLSAKGFPMVYSCEYNRFLQRSVRTYLES